VDAAFEEVLFLVVGLLVVEVPFAAVLLDDVDLEDLPFVARDDVGCSVSWAAGAPSACGAASAVALSAPADAVADESADRVGDEEDRLAVDRLERDEARFFVGAAFAASSAVLAVVAGDEVVGDEEASDDGASACVPADVARRGARFLRGADDAAAGSLRPSSARTSSSPARPDEAFWAAPLGAAPPSAAASTGAPCGAAALRVARRRGRVVASELSGVVDESGVLSCGTWFSRPVCVPHTCTCSGESRPGRRRPDGSRGTGLRDVRRTGGTPFRVHAARRRSRPTSDPAALRGDGGARVVWTAWLRAHYGTAVVADAVAALLAGPSSHPGARAAH